MEMNRRSWLRWLPAALLPWTAKGQRAVNLPPTVPTGMCIGVGSDGKYGAVECPVPPTQAVKFLRWMSGKALNNQCPVCGTMAEPYLRQTNFEAYGHLIGTLPPIERGIFGFLGDHDHMWDRMNEDDAIKRPTKMIGPSDRDVRCARCNCKFVQDADR